jgi:hypothetical protein
MTTPYDIGGQQFSLTSATIDIDGNRVLGATSVKHKEELKPGEVEGTSPVPVGWTTGPWSGTAGFAAPLAEAMDLLSNLGGSFGTRTISATWTWEEINGPGVRTLEIIGGRVSAADLDAGDRSKPSMITFDITLTTPSLWNGVSIVDIPSVGGAGFVLSIGGP